MQWFSRRGFWLSLALVTVVLLWRRPDVYLNAQLWAEDGRVFFHQARFARWESFFLAYAGYLHLAARLAAFAGSFLPLSVIPHFYAAASWLFIAGLVLYIHADRFSISPIDRLALSLLIAANAVGNEPFFSISNWAFLTPLFLTLLLVSDDPGTPAEKRFDLSLLAFAGLSTPFSVFLWPLYFLRSRIRGGRHSLLLAYSSVPVGAVQLLFMFGRVSESGVLPAQGQDILRIPVYRFLYMFFGEEVVNWSFPPAPAVLGLAAVAGIYLALGFLYARNKSWAALLVLLSGILVQVVSFYVLRHDLSRLTSQLGRHYLLPAVTFAWSLVLYRGPGHKFRWLGVMPVFAAFIIFTPGSKNQVLRDLGWQAELARCIDVHPICRIPIHPQTDPPTWYVFVDLHRSQKPAFQFEEDVNFGDKIALIGYEVVPQEGGSLLRFGLEVLNAMDADYLLHVEMYPEPGPDIPVAESQWLPYGGDYPTTAWFAGEFLVGEVFIASGRLPEGSYAFAVQWMDVNAGISSSLRVVNPGDHTLLTPAMPVLPAVFRFDGP